MKKILTILLIICLFSCEKKKETKNETPEALQESTKLTTRYSGRGDLVNDIYNELVSKSPELQKLEKEIEDLNTQESQNEFKDYDNKSINFYSSVNGHAKSITDSILKTKMLEIIKNSNTKYSLKSAEFQKLSKTIVEKNKSIADNHTVLKILLSMPEIEKYQTKNPPDRKGFYKVIKKQDSLIGKIQNQFPK